MKPSALRNGGDSYQQGATLIEVLVTVIVTVIGLLGAVALQTRAYATESESYQRAQAAVLLEDMANRIRANKLEAAAYVAPEIGAGAIDTTCAAAATVAARDLCEWANLLRGAAETHSGNSVGAMIGARSCITRPDPAVDLYVIAVVWQGTVQTAAPTTACGAAMGYGNLRRALSTVVRIPDLD